MKNLETVLAYKNHRVISKFREDYYFDEDEAKVLFKDLLAWLWLAAKTNDSKLCSIYHSMAVLDKMWHTFFIFSKDYAAFCESELGMFIHHEPHTREDEIEKITSNPDYKQSLKQISSEITNFQNLVFDELGMETLLRWFVRYPHVYNPEELHRRTRVQFSQRGFQKYNELRAMNKEQVLNELKKDHEVLAYCGGHGCGAYCRDPK